MLLLLAWLWIQVKAWFARNLCHPRGNRGRRRLALPEFRRTQPKPAWVTREIIRLKALMPDAGCRTLANIFNRCFATSRKMTVGKSFVADTIRRHRYEIEMERRRIKHRIPPPLPRNLVWGLDLTGKTDTQGKLHTIFGLIDNGSRGLLTLAALPDKCSWTLLGHLFLAIGKYGRPRAVRTDNEACFTSRVFRVVLALAGIRQQRSDPGCPWQNGRIERVFGTLKQKLDQWEVAGFAALNVSLGEFRLWYNHVRPHQHLGGATPAEAWAGVNPFAVKHKGQADGAPGTWRVPGECRTLPMLSELHDGRVRRRYKQGGLVQSVANNVGRIRCIAGRCDGLQVQLQMIPVGRMDRIK